MPFFLNVIFLYILSTEVHVLHIISQASCVLKLPHLFDGEVVDEVMVVFVQVAVEGDTVALIEQVLQRVNALDSQRALQAVLKVGVVEDHIETKCLGPHGHCLTCSA